MQRLSFDADPSVGNRLTPHPAFEPSLAATDALRADRRPFPWGSPPVRPLPSKQASSLTKPHASAAVAVRTRRPGCHPLTPDGQLPHSNNQLGQGRLSGRKSSPLSSSPAPVKTGRPLDLKLLLSPQSAPSPSLPPPEPVNSSPPATFASSHPPTLPVGRPLRSR